VVALFKDRSPATILWLFILSVVVHSQFILVPPAVVGMEDDGIISMVLHKYVSHLNPLLITLLYHAIVLIQALRLNYLFSDNRMFSKVNFLTAMVYILLTGIFDEWSLLSPALIANIMIIWFFAKTVHLYNSPNPLTLIFNIGLIIGATILLYHPAALLILVAFFALLIVRPLLVNEWLVLLMGVAAPFYFLFSYLYLTDQWNHFERFLPHLQLNLPDLLPTILFFITIAVIAIILFIGIFYFQKENRRMLIQVRKNWIVLQVMLFVMLPIPFISRNAGMDTFLLLIVPLSPFIAKGFFAPKKETLPNIMFWTLIVLVLLNNWYAVIRSFIKY
jgi:hypothetical protein